jgi:hypothetical protein
MSLQNRILKEYRTLYPHHPLRETARLTGIQLTRVFRLFNGAPMKLEEYERFHQVVHGEHANSLMDGPFRRVTESLARTFDRQDLSKITAFLERQLQWHHIIHGGLVSNQSDFQTA